MASPEEMRELTGQFKANTEELQSFLRDLDHWTEDMSLKDEQLKASKKQKKKDPDSSTQPADKGEIKIKESLDADEIKSRSASVQSKHTPAKPSNEKIKSSDYAKWDAFDVDRALADIDKVPKITDVTDGNEQEDGGEDEFQLKQRAVSEKERGNEHFRLGQYEQAVQCYTRGMQCDPRNAILPANRAMALLKQSKFSEAERDCTLALSLDPTYAKALQRRGTARSRLKRVKEAIADYERVLELEPKNKQAKLELDKLLKVTEKEEGETKKKKDESVKTASGKDDEFSHNIRAAFTKTKQESQTTKKDNASKAQTLEPGQVLNIDKPPHKRSKKPLKRIEIIDETDDSEKSKIEDMEQEEPTDNKMEVDNKETVPPTPYSKCSTPGSKSTGLARKVEAELSSRLADSATLGDDSCTEKTSARPAAAASSCNLKPLPAKPRSSVQFSQEWKRLDRHRRRDYLKQLKGSDYPLLFKHSLEPEMFSDIIELLSELEPKDNAGDHLLGLTSVPRVSALTMFMSQEERSRVSKILSDNKDLKSDHVKKIRSTFEL